MVKVQFIASPTLVNIMSNKPIDELIAVMKRLRDPNGGCPWDIEQDFKSIAPYTIEEAYEVADAIEQNDMPALEDELGDLLLQVVYHAQMAQEAGHFNFDDVAAHVTAKMIHRHPHVFGEAKAASAADVEGRIWEEQKALEKRKKDQDSILGDVPLALPAVLRAQKLQKRAARVGFEWPEAVQVLDKLEEEIQELREALNNKDKLNIREELGDMLFCVVNYGRMIGVDCESALRDTNNKFERRFRGVERELGDRCIELEDATLEEMESIWNRQKVNEKNYEQLVSFDAYPDEGVAFIRAVVMPHGYPVEFDTKQAREFAEKILDGVDKIEKGWVGKSKPAQQ